jgi:hypothetical protein
LIIGRGKNKIILPLYPTKYRGETQDDDSGITTENQSETDSEESEIEPTQKVNKEIPYKSMGLGQYFTPLVNIDDSDDAILAWENSEVLNINIDKNSDLEPELQSDAQEIEDLLAFSDPTFLRKKTFRESLNTPLQDMNLGIKENPQIIKVYSKMTKVEFNYWYTFFKRHKSSFAWSYADLKGVPPEICEHKIELEPDAKAVRQRQYRMNPKYSLMVKEEIDKLLACGFIFEVPYSEWVSPIVIVPKKNGKLRICQDYRKLNSVTKKDHFPLPFTDTLLDGVAGYECYSFMDGFSGYNQIQIAQRYRLLTAFTTDWGIFAHTKMPFGLCNAPATFQRLMTIAFQMYLRKFMEIFLDDFCVYSTKKKHTECLEKCFVQCEKYGISINAAKSQFAVPFGKLVGHIVSKQGIATDPDKVAIIVQLSQPNTITEVRAFLGHVGYYRRYIYKYANIALPLTELTKKTEIPPVWTETCTKAFETLKHKLTSAPVLIPPDWNKDFEVYVDASNVAIGSVLSQKDEKGHDRPIYFASRQLAAAEKNYTVTEREALGMIFSVQKFRHYLLGYKFTFHVDHDALKYMINKPQLSGQIARWVLLLQEFNFTIQVRPGKSHANADHLSRINLELGSEPINDDFPDAALFQVEVIPTEYADIIHFLSTGQFPIDYSEKQKKILAYKVTPYTLIAETLYKRGKDEILRRCVNPSEIPLILEGCHSDICGGHFAGLVTAQKALQSGYWWPTMFADAAKFARKCDPCQRVGKPTPTTAMPLTPILAQVPFEKWGIDFVGPINPPSRNGRKRYILVATEYVTKWAEALATRNDDANTVAKFLYEYIITRFGCPKELVSDRGTHFINDTIATLTEKYFIKHRKTSPYHPRANGQTEKTNGILCKIITKTVQGANIDWDARVLDALWAYRTAYKVTTKHTPFQLVYGQEAILPIELEVQSLRIAIDHRLGDIESLQERMGMLEKLDETRRQAYFNTLAIQNCRKSYYDSKLLPKNLQPNDLVLLFDSRFHKFPGKFKMRWLGPYKVLKSYSNGSVELQDFSGNIHSTRYNGYRLKPYIT